MSDAQPRKRKNKGKKKGDQPELVKERPVLKKLKEDSFDEEILTSVKNPSDEVIHVQKEVGCGGNVFTKLIFFGLLASIGLMVGVILLEFRGSSDEETASALDSPWSVTFENWVDKEPQHHGDHSEETLEGDDEEEEHAEDHEEPHVTDEGGGGTILNWFGYDKTDEGGGDESPDSDDEVGLIGSLLNILSFGRGEVEDPEDDSDVASDSGWGWFGYGGDRKDPDDVVEEEQEEDSDAGDEKEEDEEEIYEPDEDVSKEDDDLEEEEEMDEEDDDETKTIEGDSEEAEPIQEDEEDSNEDLGVAKNFENLLEEEEEEEEEDYEKDDGLPDPEEDDIDDEEVDKNVSEEKEDNDEGFDEISKEDTNIEYNTEEEEGEREEEEDEERTDPLSGEAEEDLFPEAREALRLEREAAAAAEAKAASSGGGGGTEDEEGDEGYSESLTQGDEETEGTEETGAKVEAPWAEEAARELQQQQSPPPVPAPASAIPTSPLPQEAEQTESLAVDGMEGGEEEEEETGGEEEEEEERGGVREEEEVESDVEIDKDKFKELIAKYGHDTPESSDIEPSDDDLQKVEYSEGEDEDAEGEEEEEESEDGRESQPEEISDDDEQAPSEDEWTGIKKSDIEKMTRLESGSEDGEEEEESEDEPAPAPTPAPVPPRQRGGGGPRDYQEGYLNDLITNDEDWAIREELDLADEEFNYETAHAKFSKLLERYPDSPRARYGLARSLDRIAEQGKSNKLLEVAITSYQHSLAAPNVPDNLYIAVASRLIDRLRFRGFYQRAAEVQKQLIQRFEKTPEYRNDLAVTYLMMNDLESGRLVLKEVLKLWPEDPTALAHYGLVLKLQGNIHGSIKYLERGLDSDFLRDARLYFHLGDALSRVGRGSDALRVPLSEVPLQCRPVDGEALVGP